MALVHKNRVKATTTTSGTGTYTLGGAATGFQAFSAIGDGNTCYYCATDGTDWEVGIGTYTAAGTTLARTTILASSNAGSAVNWSGASKDIFVTIPAERFVENTRNLTAAGLVTGGGDLSADRTFTVTAAVQADLESASSTTTAVTPAVVQYHPGVCKAWCYLKVTSNVPALTSNYNITSITDTATGEVLITIATDFSSANYNIQCSPEVANNTVSNSNTRIVNIKNASIAAGTVSLLCQDAQSSGATRQDPASWHFGGWGDQ